MHAIRTGARLLTALALAVMLLPWAHGPAAPARADEARHPTDSDHRIQFVIKSIKILDDRDWGEGDFLFRMFFYRVVPGCPIVSPEDECSDDKMASSSITFGADDGEVKVLDRAIPDEGDGAWVLDPSIGPDVGIPIWKDQTYVMVVHGLETDTVLHDRLGEVRWVLNAENGWRYGTSRERSSKDDGKTRNGDFEIEIEVRDPPLPDLRAGNIKVLNAPGSTEKLVCMSVVNAGAVDSGPFEVSLRVDGVIPKNGKTGAGRLPSGMHGELCVQTALPPGPHRLTSYVDEPRAVVEVIEIDNRFELQYVAPAVAGAQDQPPATTPAPGSSPSPGQPDLIVTAIRVRGQVPDGKDDCKEGKNPVTVVVKNVGTANAGPFVVRITVDEVQGDDIQAYAVVASTDGLEAGQEREVRFDEVKLKKGTHALAAVADYKLTVAESTDGNNDREVAVRCTDDD